MTEKDELFPQIAWVMKSKLGVTVGVSAIHRVFENGKTFCNHAVPEEWQQLQPLKSLDVCARCERMAARAATFAETLAKRPAA